MPSQVDSAFRCVYRYDGVEAPLAQAPCDTVWVPWSLLLVMGLVAGIAYR
jgi:hypothetical protein